MTTSEQSERGVEANAEKIENWKLKISLTRLLLLVTCALLLVAPSVSAQGGAISPTIGVSPAKLFETVQPGKSQEYKIKLRNLGADALPLSGSVTGVSDISDEGVPIFAETVAQRSASSWVTLPNKDIIVSSGETKEVTLIVKPPKDAAPGGYTAAIIFQAQLPSYYFDLDASARILPAISVLAFFTIAGAGEITIDQISIESLRAPRIAVSSPISLVAEVKNASNFFIQTDAEVSVKGSFSKHTSTDKLGTVILLPEKNRKFVAAFEQNFMPGIYTASINFKQGDKTLVGAVKFVALPWPFIIIVIALALGMLGLAGRRRFKRAWAVLRGREAHPIRRPTLR